MVVAFFVAFAGFGILGSLYFFILDGDTKRKERLHRPYVIGLGLAVLAFVVAADGSAGTLLVGAPAVALISWGNIRNTRFCHNCGRTNYTVQWWTRPRFCTACGGPLDQPDA